MTGHKTQGATISNKVIVHGAMCGWGSPFGHLTENGFFYITSHAWYA